MSIVIQDKFKDWDEPVSDEVLEEELPETDEAAVEEAETSADDVSQPEGETEEAQEELLEEENENSEDEYTESSEKKKGLFGKKEKQPDKRDEQIAELTDQKQRLMAEFDNFRKRTEKEKAAMFEIGAKSVIEKLLPIVDNFERGLASVSEEEKDSSFANGMDMIYKQLLKMLEEMEVTPIEAVGQEFNPDLHNAVMHIESEEVGENIIVQEFQKGYKYRNSVIRHSMVQVAN